GGPAPRPAHRAGGTGALAVVRPGQRGRAPGRGAGRARAVRRGRARRRQPHAPRRLAALTHRPPPRRGGTGAAVDRADGRRVPQPAAREEGGAGADALPPAGPRDVRGPGRRAPPGARLLRRLRGLARDMTAARRAVAAGRARTPESPGPDLLRTGASR